MSGWTRSKPELIAAATGAALAGALAVAGMVSRPAAVTLSPAVTRAGLTAATHTAGHVVAPGGRNRRLQSSEFSDWPMFHADPTHSGVSPETTIGTANAASLTAGWTATLGTTSYVSPVVATSSTLGEAVVYAAAQSHFYAYPATGGSPIWTFKTGKGGGAFDASPAVFDGVAYEASSAGTIYALNASTGAELCSFSVGDQLIQASPVVVSDPDGSGPVLYVGTDPPSGAGAEYAIYGAGNTHGACTQDWEFSSWAVADSGSWSPPAYGTDANGNPLLVFGSVGPDDSVYALNASTGVLDWRYQTSTVTSFDVGAGPTLSAPGNNGFADGVVYVPGKDKSVYALNLTTGKKIWSYKLSTNKNSNVSTASLDGDALYLGSNDGVYALNATTGALIWQALAGPTFYASPAITGPTGQQVLVIGDNAGNLYALDLATGSTLWTLRPNTAGFWASPAISQGAIYAVGIDGVLRTYSPSGI
jgi:outer membrane protein assembly factor BamB